MRGEEERRRGGEEEAGLPLAVDGADGLQLEGLVAPRGQVRQGFTTTAFSHHDQGFDCAKFRAYFS